MTYKIINTLTGDVTPCSLSELSRELRPTTILAEYAGQQCVDSYPITHNMLVFFAVEFAEYALLNYVKNVELTATASCIALTRKWIADNGSVTEEELTATAHAAYAADAAAAYAATALATAAADAAYAAYAARAARAARAAAAYAAVNAAHSAAYAARCAADAHAAAAAAAWGGATDTAHVAANIVNAAAAYAQAGGANETRVECIREEEYARQGEFILEYLRGV